MKQNSETTIFGSKVVLVPYKKEHVPKYHRWMKRRELQEETASEPLTEREEYEMQETWFNDEKKCTFIILDKKTYEMTDDEVASMIGDVNLYLDVGEQENRLIPSAECGLMIAESQMRRQGMGTESLLLMMKYGFEHLSIRKYFAKISFKNSKSIMLFQKIGFQEVSKSDVFEEITLEKVLDDDWTRGLQETENSRTEQCHINPPES